MGEEEKGGGDGRWTLDVDEFAALRLVISWAV
jgi:hypothetical protein